MKSKIPFEDFSKTEPFPTILSLLCESERVKAVDPSEIPEEGMAGKDILEFPGHKSLVYGVEFGEPLVGELWLKYLALIIETSLENINSIGEDYIKKAKGHDNPDEVFSEDERKVFDVVNTFGDDLRRVITKEVTSIMLKIIAEGPRELKIVGGQKTMIIQEFFADFELCSSNSNFATRAYEDSHSIFFFALALISYWQKHGYPNIYCPLATLIGKMYDCGLFSLLPMFDTENLEQLRPLIQECKKAYGTFAKYLYQEIFTYLILDGDESETLDYMVSSASAIAFKMLKDEWLFVKELPNEEPEVKTSEE